MSTREFKIGDIVKVGQHGEKGKIVDMYKSLGTYVMYKVHTYGTGEILTVAKHELVKGLADEDFQDIFNFFSADEFDQFMSSIDFQSFESGNPPIKCESLPSATCVSSHCDNLNATFGHSELVTPVHKRKLDETSETESFPSKRFPLVSLDPAKYRDAMKNKNTEQKTTSHMKTVTDFLTLKGEQRPIHQIPPAELNNLLKEFVIRVRQRDGSEYEPSSIRGSINSVDRYLNDKEYGTSVARGAEFCQTMATLKSKLKDLKKQGKGNKDMASDHLTDLEIDQLYTTGQLGNSCPDSLINTLWFNNTIHIGIRGEGSEHRQLKFGDIVLGYDNDMNFEFLDYKERQTKTRTGENITNVRRQHPRLYATGSDRCPVLTYKAYANHRPENFSGPDHPFYLAVVTHSKLPAENDQWFLSAPIGRNKLSSLMKVMSQKAGLPDMQSGKRITNTSVRKTLCQKLLQANVPDTRTRLLSTITGFFLMFSRRRYQI